jgi:2-polyprenyl-6-methoxyphenol hydroxylase-like FAD-dependent oxidoreductase
MAPKIAIVGAGPAGLTLASLLRVSGQTLHVTIFEKDASVAERSHKGGTLDLHDDTGLAAIRAANLWESFKKYARYDGQDFVFSDKNANRLLEDIGREEAEQNSAAARPEIDRGRLQEILLNSVPAEWIRWGSHLRSVSGEGFLNFDHAVEGPFDLIVGADGAWSKVRPELTENRPSYTGISGFEMYILNPIQDHPKVSKMVGRGSYFAFSDCKALQAQRLGDSNIMVYGWKKHEENFSQNLWKKASHDGEKLKMMLLDTLFRDWAPEMQDWIRAASPNTVRPWSLYELHIGITWDHKKGVTLIGDAAHLMSPFAGEGVNAAMKDALELAKAITASMESGSQLDSAIKEYERAMFIRAQDVMEMTMMMKTLQFREDAPLGFLEKMNERIGGGSPDS